MVALFKRILGFFSLILGLNSMQKERKSREEQNQIVIPKMVEHPDQKDLEVFLTIVQCLNEGLEDPRLEYLQDTVFAMYELRDFNSIQGRYSFVHFNQEADSQGYMKVFYEV